MKPKRKKGAAHGIGCGACLVIVVIACSIALAAANAHAKRKAARPKSHAIPQIVIDSLAAGDINAAAIAMHDEPANPKLLYLMREVGRIAIFRMNGRPSRSEAHSVYQNVANAYHNLYLFLKSKGIDQGEFLEEAHEFYKKARRTGTLFHKAECDVLEAALYASEGDVAKAEKKFGKIDPDMMRGDFESMEYLAAYYAATGNVDYAINYLKAAHSVNPERAVAWLAVGDDFMNIEDNPRFEGLMKSWRAQRRGEEIVLSVPKSKSPRLEVTDESGLFRPQKTMPRYKRYKLRRRGR